MNGEGKIYGYARVSSKDQNLDRQLCALEEFGVDRGMIYCDKMSGKDFNRPSYRKLMRKLKPGDVLVVKSIDRLGRNYNEILEEWRVITKVKNVSIVVLDMPLLDTRENIEGITGVFIADLVLQLLSYVSQIERENIKTRQAEGIEAAKARGVRFGRPKIPIPPNFEEINQCCSDGIYTRKQAAEKLGVCTATFNSWRNDH